MSTLLDRQHGHNTLRCQSPVVSVVCPLVEGVENSQVRLELVMCNLTSLRQAVHSFPYLNIHKAFVVFKLVEVIFFDDFLWDERH
eukprot:10449844-Ditylum_brightwellii.AAC.1